MARKKVNTKIPFTEEEIQYIIDTPALKLKDLAFMLKRSYDSVRRKKWALENKHRNTQAKLEYKKRLQEEINGGNKDYNIWTKSEEELILTSKLTDRELAHKLKRTVGSIQVKRNRLLKEQENAKRNSTKVRKDDQQS